MLQRTFKTAFFGNKIWKLSFFAQECKHKSTEAYFLTHKLPNTRRYNFMLEEYYVDNVLIGD